MNKPEQDQALAARPRWLRWLRDIVLLLLIFAAVQWWQARDLAAGLAPPLAGLLSDGREYRLSPADGPVLVYFWASWCPVCRLEQGNIEAIASDSEVITIATNSGSAAEVNAYLDEQGLGMKVLMDETGDIARHWGATGVPASFIVDRDGRIAYAGMGYATEIGLRARMWLAD